MLYDAQKGFKMNTIQRNIVKASLCASAIVCMLTGCYGKPLENNEQPDEQTKQTRFIVNDGYRTYNVDSYRLLIDTETGVQYLIYDTGYYQAMSVLMNPDGTPIVCIE